VFLDTQTCSSAGTRPKIIDDLSRYAEDDEAVRQLTVGVYLLSLYFCLSVSIVFEGCSLVCD
jgi:hypothetical protein